MSWWSNILCHTLTDSVPLCSSSIHALVILYSSSSIIYASSIHPLFILYSSSIHPLFILHSSSIHLPCILYSSSIQSLIHLVFIFLQLAPFTLIVTKNSNRDLFKLLIGVQIDTLIDFRAHRPLDDWPKAFWLFLLLDRSQWFVRGMLTFSSTQKAPSKSEGWIEGESRMNRARIEDESRMDQGWIECSSQCERMHRW
jgi:hypothetical protein